MKQNVFLILISVLFLGCAPSTPEVPSLHSTRQFQNQSTFESMRNFEIDSLRNSTVSEFMVLIFKEDFSPDEWKKIFLKTNEFSKNRNQPEPDPEISSSFLEYISEKAAFLLQWSEKPDRCKVSDNLILRCPDESQPKATAPLEWVKPTFTDSVKVPYLKIRLARGDDYQIEIKFRLEEPASDTNNWTAVFSGDARPAPGSSFVNPKGDGTAQFYPVGVSQLRLKVRN